MSNPPSQSPSRSGSRSRHRHRPYPTDTYHGGYDASYNPNNGYYGHPEPYPYQGAQDNQYYGHGQSQSEYESAYYGSGYQDQYYQTPQADWASSAYSNTAYASSSSAHHVPYRPMTSAFAQSLSHSQPNRPYSTSAARYTHSHSQSYARRAPSEPSSSSPPSSQPDLFTAEPFLHPPSHPKSKAEDRPRRSPSPPSPSPTPTPAYLATAHTPSTRLAGPTALRRLLVLDLNGTLLLRSARRPAPRDAPPPPRRVHPRPYLPSLRAYLVHAHTRAWLDVMVWSSAQPHNVADMVRHAFGEDAEEHLLAVWARDTLGLAPDRYHRKVQTIKDLAKPWLELARLSSPPSSRPSSPAPSPPAQTSVAQVHSAETTLLLDDSVRKAALQPYNHVCIREYTQTVRNADLRSLAAAALPARDDTEVGAVEEEEEDERKRRRKERKVRRMAERRAAAEAGVQVQVQAVVGVDVDVEEALSGPEPELDETLLAVIGILHAVRWESNVAGWIFGGALWGPHGASTRTGEIKTGNDIQSGTALEEAEEAEVGEEGEEPAERAAPLWFEREEVVQYWAAKGREALEELGLEVVHGITN